MYRVPNEAAVAGGREYKGKQVARFVFLNCISSLLLPETGCSAVSLTQYGISCVFEDLHYTL